jgi:rubrerythrin
MALDLAYHQQNCANKIPYLSRREAKHAAKRIQSKSGVRSDVYECQVCGYFHTTSLSKYASRRARQAVKRVLQTSTNASF